MTVSTLYDRYAKNSSGKCLGLNTPCGTHLPIGIHLRMHTFPFEPWRRDTKVVYTLRQHETNVLRDFLESYYIEP